MAPSHKKEEPWLLRFLRDSGIVAEVEKELRENGLKLVQDFFASLKEPQPRLRPGAGAARNPRAPIEEEDLDPDDPYVVLGVRPGVPPEVIDAVYRALVKRVHPDVGGDKEAFQRVHEAYQKIRGR